MSLGRPSGAPDPADARAAAGHGPAAQHWRDLVEVRAAQMDAAYARLGRTSADFWNRRAKAFHRATRDGTSDPFYRLVRRHVGARSSVLDVGAGTGRFSVALAPLVARVVAVEPNDSMLGILRDVLAEQGIDNVETVHARWEETEGLAADVVVASHVLYPLADATLFLERLDRATRRRCFLTLRAIHLDALTDPLWRHFHGEPRRLPPTYIDALNLLHELGIFAEVAVLDTPQSWRYDSVEAAAEEMLEQLILPDTPGVRAELQSLLGGWLVRDDLGLRPPLASMPVGVLSWGPRERASYYRPPRP